MDCYRDLADVETAFVSFMDKVPFYGAVTACIDNRGSRSDSAPRASTCIHLRHGAKKLITVSNFSRRRPGCFSHFPGSCAIRRHQARIVRAARVPGRHNVLNATAAVAIAHQLEIGVWTR